MSIQILDWPNAVSSTFDLNFVRFHSFLDASSDFSQSGINSCLSDSSISGILDCFEQLIVSGVEGDSEGTVNHSALDMGAKVNFADVVVCDDSIIAWVWSVVGCYMVKGTASGESNA